MNSTYTKLADNIANMRQKWSSKKKISAHDQDYIHNITQEDTFPLESETQYTNRQINISADVDYQHHDEYLNAITTSINCETDLKLYQILHCFSNKMLGMIGVKIKSSSLQAAYNSNEYLIRCYCNHQKFLEIPLSKQPYYIELMNQIIVYILEDDIETIHIVQVEVPKNQNQDTLEINSKTTKSKALKYITKTQKVVKYFSEIISIKIGHFNSVESLKLVIMTEQQIFIIPVELDKNKNNVNLINKEEENVYELKQFDFGEPDILIEDNKSSYSEETFPSNNKIMKFFDYGVNPAYPESFEQFGGQEMLLALDQKNHLQVFSAVSNGIQFKRRGRIPLRRIPMVEMQNQLLDAAFISNTKVITLEMADGSLSETHAHDLLGSQSSKPADISNNYIRIQFWEIHDQHDISKSASILIPEDMVTPQFLAKWRQDILIDYNNNDAYLPYYTSTEGTYCKFKIDNETKNAFEITILTENVIKDIIGSHKLKSQLTSSAKGSLYQSFLVLDKWLVLSHGRFITVTDLTLPIGQWQQHLSINEKSSTLQGYYDMSQEIFGMYLSDNVTKTNEFRWQIIVFFTNGTVKELICPHLDTTYSSAGLMIKLQTTIKLANSQLFTLVNYLKDKDGKPVRIKGSLLKIYRSSTDNQVPFLIQVEKRDKSMCLCTIEYKKQILREYKIQNLNKRTTVILLSSKDLAYQDVMLVNTIIDEQGYVVGQKKLCLKLKTDLNVQDNNCSYQIYDEDDMPKLMNNILKTNKVYVFGEEIYFVHSKYIEKYNINTGEVEQVQTPDFFAAINIQDETFAYWRQSSRKKTMFSLKSSIFFDNVQSLSDMKNKGLNKELVIFSGLQPHLERIYYDTTSETLSAFVDYNTIKVWPLLHRTGFKIKGSGKRLLDTQILATKLINHKLYTINSDNTANEWNIKNGKLIQQWQVSGYQDYIFHQTLDSNFIVLRSTKVRPYCNIEAPKVVLLNNKSTKSDVHKLLFNEFKNFKHKDHNDQDGIQERFKIDSLCSQTVQITDYKVIQISQNNDQSVEDNTINASQQNFNEYQSKISIGNVEICEIMSFEGPCNIDNNNLGLFASSDLQLFIFYFRDPQTNLKLYYYKQIYDLKNKKTHLVYQLHATKDTTLSMHSKDFQYLLKENTLSGQMELTLYNQHRQTLDEDSKLRLIQQNKDLQNFYNLSEDIPSFITDTDAAFINRDNIVTIYDMIDQKIQTTITRSPFVGASDKMKLNTIFKSNNHIVGEDLMLIEKYKVEGKPQQSYELVAPNNFNKFFQNLTKNINDEARDSTQEHIYVQQHYKTKIELIQRSYFGYIFQAKEYLPIQSYKTDINIVTTFSYYHWRVIKQIKNKSISMDEIEKELLKEVCFTQLPDGSTLLHQIMTNEELVDKVLSIITEDKIPFYIPILQDNRGKTVMDYLLDPIKNETLTRYNPKQVLTVSKSILQNLNQVAVCIMNHMHSYPFDIFKIHMLHLIPKMMDADIWAFSQFMDARCKPLLIYEDTLSTKSENSAVKIFSSNEVVYQQNLDIEKILDSKNPYAIEIQMKVLDMPYVHCEQNGKSWGYDTLNLIYDKLALNESDDIFGNDAIKALIEVRWHFIKQRIIYYLMIPHIAYIGLIMAYIIEDLESYFTITELNLQKKSQRLRIAILVFTGYFMIMKIVVLMRTGLIFFSRLWNYYDLFSFAFIVSAEAVLSHCLQAHYDPRSLSEDEFNFCQNNDKIVRTLYAFVALFIFGRCLYFFRVYRSTGYYIRMFVEVIGGLSHFVFIFLFQVIAFSLAFFVFAKNGSDKVLPTMPYALQYAYLASFDYYTPDIMNDDYYPFVQWFFFLILNFLLQIVMLNLLISIVSDTFNRIKSNYNVIMYKDMMHLINENKYLSFGQLPELLSQKYLFVASTKELPNQEQINSDHILNSMDSMMKKIKTVNRNVKSSQLQMRSLSKIEDREQRIQERLEKLEDKNELIMVKLDLLLNKLK